LAASSFNYALGSICTATLFDVNPGVITANISAFIDLAPVQFRGLPKMPVMTPDFMHIWLFQEIVSHNGSVAFALQSLLTTITTMAYYDQLAQFDSSAAISQSFYIETNLPKTHWGWLAVVIALAIHLVICWTVFTWFIVGTEFTMLGENWAALAQASTPDAAEYIEMAGQMTDDEVKEEMEEETRVEKAIAASGKPLSQTRVRLHQNSEGKVGIFIEKEKMQYLLVLLNACSGRLCA
jgi:hypothetical protein